MVIDVILTNYINQEHGTYNYNFNVKDAHSSVDYGKQETSNGKGAVSGSYHVMLPDGRKQKVTYHADENGYVADIQYEGEAKNDETPYSAGSYPTIYAKKDGKKDETPQHNYPVNHYPSTTTEKYHDTYSTTPTKDHQMYHHQTHYVKANIPQAKYPDIYSTPYNTGHETHHTPYAKDNTHSATAYNKGQYHHQAPYVKEHGASSIKYNPNPHPKYPHHYSTSYPKASENYQTPYVKSHSNHPVPYTQYPKGSYNHGTLKTAKYHDIHPTTYSNGQLLSSQEMPRK